MENKLFVQDQDQLSREAWKILNHNHSLGNVPGGGTDSCKMLESSIPSYKIVRIKRDNLFFRISKFFGRFL